MVRKPDDATDWVATARGQRRTVIERTHKHLVQQGLPSEERFSRIAKCEVLVVITAIEDRGAGSIKKDYIINRSEHADVSRARQFPRSVDDESG